MSAASAPTGRSWAAASLAFLLVACQVDVNEETGTLEEAAEATPEWCDTAAAVGWEDFGEGFLLTHCQSCHASLAPERHGAPESVSFDTESQASQWAEAILRTVIDQATMPPAGGVTEAEKELLAAWLTCG